MLIASARHRPEDLALWQSLEEADLRHSQRLLRSGKIARSLEAIRQFLAGGSAYCSVSWGKDSTAVAHLLWQVAPTTPLVNLRCYPIRNPYCDSVRDSFLSRYPFPYHEEQVEYDADPRAPRVVWDRVTGPAWDSAWRRVSRRFGKRHISGVRGDESGIRAISLRKLGLSSLHSCRPLGWWKALDVFAYLARHSLPVHPNYAMVGGGRYQREHLRVADLGEESGSAYGRAEWEAEYYPELLNRFLAAPRAAAERPL